MNDNEYPQAVVRIVEHLGLPKDRNGLLQLSNILMIPKVRETTIREGEFEGCLDTERIDSEILPKVLQEHPEVRAFLERPDMKENEVTLATLANWSHSFIERFHLILGDRPLPSHHVVPVKNIIHLDYRGEPGPQFGFLKWSSPGCKVLVTRDASMDRGHESYEVEYPTMWDAFVAGWNVD